MEISFYLKEDQPDADGRLMIHGRVCWQSEKRRFSTGEKVQPKDWKEAGEQVRSGARFASHINQTLGTYKDHIRTFFYTRQNQPAAGPVLAEELTAEIKRIRITLLGKIPKAADLPPIVTGPAYPDLFDFFPQYIEDMKASRTDSWARSVRVVGEHMQAFRPGLDWSGLKLNTLNQFKVYLQEEEDHSDNTIHTYIGLFKGLCEYAEQNSIPVPRDYAWVDTRPGKVIRPVLETEDERLIANATLVRSDMGPIGEPDYLEKVRWFFLLACQTGLRRVDQWQFLNPVINVIENTNCLMALQQKTGNRVAIPLTDDTYFLLRNPVASKKPPVGKSYNRLLKSIAEQAGLNREVTVGSFYKGRMEADLLPLHQVISSHIARRTFATRMTDSGLNSFFLKELLGHESIASTQKYQSVSNQSIVQHTLEAFRRRNA